MKNTQKIQEFLDEITVLRGCISNEEDMMDSTFHRIDRVELCYDDTEYKDLVSIVSKCNSQINLMEDRICELWMRIDSLGGSYVAIN